MFTIMKMFSWPSHQHGIDGIVGSVNGGSKKARYGWRRWEQWCIAYDMDAGKVYTYVDGDEDGASNVNPETNFKNGFDTANKKVKEPYSVTDVLVGCQLIEDMACEFYKC